MQLPDAQEFERIKGENADLTHQLIVEDNKWMKQLQEEKNETTQLRSQKS